LRGIHAAVTRRSRGGGVAGPDETVTLSQALEAYTLGAARAGGLDSVCGRLEAGRRADFLVLDRNPLEGAPDDFLALKIEETWAAGLRFPWV